MKRQLTMDVIIVALGSALFHAAISFVVLTVFAFVVFGSVPLTIILTPLVIAPFALMVLGFAWFLAALGVFLRDINQFIAPVTTAVMFLSPVFFPLSALPEWLRPVVSLNPLTVPVESVRAVSLFGEQPDFIALGLYSLVAVFIAEAGYHIFQISRRGFADVL